MDDQKELDRRILFSLLTPSVKLARRSEFGLKELTELTRLAYFRELRAEGKTLSEAADVMKVSLRTAKRLSRSVKDNFFAPEAEHELPRRIEFMLALQPMGLARIQQVLPNQDPKEIEDALAQLEREERIELRDGRTPMYHGLNSVTRIVRDSWVARIGGLNSLMTNVAQTILGRFFNTSSPSSFARTISFRVHESQFAELRAFYEEQLLRTLADMEAAVEADDPETVELQLSFMWAPYPGDDS